MTTVRISWPARYRITAAFFSQVCITAYSLFAIGAAVPGLSPPVRATCISTGLAIICGAWFTTLRISLTISSDTIRVSRRYRSWVFNADEIERISVGFDQLWTPMNRQIATVGVRTHSGQVVLALATVFQDEIGRELTAKRLREFGKTHGIAVELPTELARGWGTHGRWLTANRHDQTKMLRGEFRLITQIEPPRREFRPPQP